MSIHHTILAYDSVETEITPVEVVLEFEQATIHRRLCSELLLGRRSLDDAPILDLSDLDAYALGVSRLHAAITFDGCAIRLEDRGSDEGTRLNGSLLIPFRSYEIQPGDTITLGRLMFRFCINML